MSNKDDYMHLEDVLKQDDECYIRFKGDAKMPNYKINLINEFEFDCYTAELMKEKDPSDEQCAILGYMRIKLFGRLMDEMPEELIHKSVVAMCKILKG